MTSESPLDILRRVFGYPSFRAHQEQIIDTALAGQDVMAVMPTSAGKSICYQVPALALGGLTVVVSPLISLMSDQVCALRELGVAAACLNSSLAAPDRLQILDQARAGELTLLYVAPERLDDPAFLDLTHEQPPRLLAIDEAHCISQWGNDFRPSYQRIREFVDQLETRCPVMALTATATRQVREDIEGSLASRTPCASWRASTGPTSRLRSSGPRAGAPRTRRSRASSPTGRSAAASSTA